MADNYNFMKNSDPTDEQLSLLMAEVASEVKEKAKKADEIFFKNLTDLVYQTILKHLIVNKNS